ncbi:hypothetical protein JKY79_01085 [Candidatus Babeliales bacterium]|nr:hypothetical protein [Candidatus Babeliales bacterium]
MQIITGEKKGFVLDLFIRDKTEVFAAEDQKKIETLLPFDIELKGDSGKVHVEQIMLSLASYAALYALDVDYGYLETQTKNGNISFLQMSQEQNQQVKDYIHEKKILITESESKNLRKRVTFFINQLPEGLPIVAGPIFKKSNEEIGFAKRIKDLKEEMVAWERGLSSENPLKSAVDHVNGDAFPEGFQSDQKEIVKQFLYFIDNNSKSIKYRQIIEQEINEFTLDLAVLNLEMPFALKKKGEEEGHEIIESKSMSIIEYAILFADRELLKWMLGLKKGENKIFDPEEKKDRINESLKDIDKYSSSKVQKVEESLLSLVFGQKTVKSVLEDLKSVSVMPAPPVRKDQIKKETLVEEKTSQIKAYKSWIDKNKQFQPLAAAIEKTIGEDVDPEGFKEISLLLFSLIHRDDDNLLKYLEQRIQKEFDRTNCKELHRKYSLTVDVHKKSWGVGFSGWAETTEKKPLRLSLLEYAYLYASEEVLDWMINLEFQDGFELFKYSIEPKDLKRLQELQKEAVEYKGELYPGMKKNRDLGKNKDDLLSRKEKIESPFENASMVSIDAVPVKGDKYQEIVFFNNIASLVKAFALGEKRISFKKAVAGEHFVVDGKEKVKINYIEEFVSVGEAQDLIKEQKVSAIQKYQYKVLRFFVAKKEKEEEEVSDFINIVFSVVLFLSKEEQLWFDKINQYKDKMLLQVSTEDYKQFLKNLRDQGLKLTKEATGRLTRYMAKGKNLLQKSAEVQLKEESEALALQILQKEQERKQQEKSRLAKEHHEVVPKKEEVIQPVPSARKFSPKVLDSKVKKEVSAPVSEKKRDPKKKRKTRVIERKEPKIQGVEKKGEEPVEDKLKKKKGDLGERPVKEVEKQAGQGGAIEIEEVEKSVTGETVGDLDPKIEVAQEEEKEEEKELEKEEQDLVIKSPEKHNFGFDGASLINPSLSTEGNLSGEANAFVKNMQNVLESFVRGSKQIQFYEVVDGSVQMFSELSTIEEAMNQLKAVTIDDLKDVAITAKCEIKIEAGYWKFFGYQPKVIREEMPLAAFAILFLSEEQYQWFKGLNTNLRFLNLSSEKYDALIKVLDGQSLQMTMQSKQRLDEYMKPIQEEAYRVKEAKELEDQKKEQAAIEKEHQEIERKAKENREKREREAQEKHRIKEERERQEKEEHQEKEKLAKEQEDIEKAKRELKALEEPKEKLIKDREQQEKRQKVEGKRERQAEVSRQEERKKQDERERQAKEKQEHQEREKLKDEHRVQEERDSQEENRQKEEKLKDERIESERVEVAEHQNKEKKIEHKHEKEDEGELEKKKEVEQESLVEPVVDDTSDDEESPEQAKRWKKLNSDQIYQEAIIKLEKNKYIKNWPFSEWALWFPGFKDGSQVGKFALYKEKMLGHYIKRNNDELIDTHVPAIFTACKILIKISKYLYLSDSISSKDDWKTFCTSLAALFTTGLKNQKFEENNYYQWKDRKLEKVTLKVYEGLIAKKVTESPFKEKELKKGASVS